MELSGYYKTRYVENVLRDRIWEHIANYLLPHLQIEATSHVLELGAGYGSWIKAVRAQHRFALDIHPEAAELAQKQGLEGVSYLVGNCTDLSRFGDGTIDVVLMSNLLEHLTLPDVFACLDECFRVLKAGGRICMIQPNFRYCFREYFDDYTHRTIFTDSSLCDVVTLKRFEITNLWKRLLPFSMKGAAPWTGALVPFYLRSPVRPRAAQLCLIGRK